MTTPFVYVFEVNWNGDGATFVDETANVEKITARRGRDYASSLVGKVQAGEMTVGLLNASQRFSEFNATSPLFGNLIPGRRARIRATAPTARTLWSGFISDTGPKTSRTAAARAELKCSGPLWWIGEQESSTEMQTSINTGAAVGKVLDDAGWPAGDRTIDTGQLAMVAWKADSGQGADSLVDPRKALSHLQELEESEMGLLSESADGKIVFEDNHHRLLTPHVTSQATFSDVSGAALSYEEIDQLSPWRFIYNRFIAEVTPTIVRSSSTLWALTGEIPAIAPNNGTYVVTAVYPPPGATDSSLSVGTWGTPTLTANSSPDGTGLDLTAKVTKVTVKNANTMQITLTNTDPTRVAYVTQLFVTGTPIKKADTGRVLAEDAASIAKYGKRTYPLGGRFYPTLARARDFVSWGLSRFKDPQPILAISFDPRLSDGHMTQALTRDISDRITVRADGTTPAGGQLGVNADFFIESIEYEIDGSSALTRCTYRLSYAGDASRSGDDYWRLDYSTLGSTTKLVI